MSQKNMAMVVGLVRSRPGACRADLALCAGIGFDALAHTLCAAEVRGALIARRNPFAHGRPKHYWHHEHAALAKAWNPMRALPRPAEPADVSRPAIVQRARIDMTPFAEMGVGRYLAHDNAIARAYGA